MLESQLDSLYNNRIILLNNLKPIDFQPTGSFHKQNEIDAPTFGV